MFFKKLDFLSLNVFYLSFIKFYTKKAVFIAPLALFMFVFVYLVFSVNFFLRSFLYGLSFFFIVYWLVSIFVYLFKKSRYGVFTRIIQRFWKRSLYLFWLLEISLFLIYLFLALISPQEVSYMLDNQQLFFMFNNNFLIFFKSLLKPLLVILISNICLLSHKYNIYKELFFIILFILLINILFDDFVQFFAINQQYNGSNWIYTNFELKKNMNDKTNNFGIWEQEVVEFKLRTYFHFIYLLIFLKLWHTIFIFYFFIFFENIRLKTKVSSFNIISANIQNFFFLYFFNYILKISLIKTYLNYLSSFVYFWFYTNQNIYDFGYFYNLYTSLYLIFIFNDISCYF